MVLTAFVVRISNLTDVLQLKLKQTTGYLLKRKYNDGDERGSILKFEMMAYKPIH